MKRLKTLLSIATLILGIPLLGIGADLSDLTYTISNNEVTITGCKTSASGLLDIPATIEGHPVVLISSGAFIGTSLTKVVIPDTVTNIYSQAFSGISTLTNVIVGTGVTRIGFFAFLDIANPSVVHFRGVEPPQVLNIMATFSPDLRTTAKVRVGSNFGETFSYNNITVTRELQITDAETDASNNLRIETDALNTTGLKVFHTTSLNSPFTEVTGVSKEGEGTVTIPAGNSAAQGTSGFYKVIYQE